MRTLLYILFAIFPLNFALAEEDNKKSEEIILPVSPKQKVLSRFKKNFAYHHDRGFYLSASFGPQWNQSIQQPTAKGIRFGGKIGAGWYVANGIALFGAAWGNFLEQASLIAGGPGIAFLFDGPNMGVDFSLGIGRAFNVTENEGFHDFSETVFSANLSIGKYWWLSGVSSLGVALNSSVYGFTLAKQKIGTFGFSAGLGLILLIG